MSKISNVKRDDAVSKNDHRLPCNHSTTATIDNDVVCSSCGVVIDEIDTQFHHLSNKKSESSPNLYEVKSMGSKQEIPNTPQNKALRNYYRGSSGRRGIKDDRNLSSFSNVCEKLSLPLHVQTSALDQFNKACKEIPRKTAEHACWSISDACKAHGIPRTDNDIISAVELAFGRKKLPSMMKISFSHSSVKDLRTLHGTRNDDVYYFNVNWKKITRGIKLRLTESELNKKKAQAWNCFKTVFLTGTYDKRSKNAINMVLGRKRLTSNQVA